MVHLGFNAGLARPLQGMWRRVSNRCVGFIDLMADRRLGNLRRGRASSLWVSISGWRALSGKNLVAVRQRRLGFHRDPGRNRHLLKSTALPRNQRATGHGDAHRCRRAESPTTG